jgi:hypothetical protein
MRKIKRPLNLTPEDIAVEWLLKILKIKANSQEITIISLEKLSKIILKLETKSTRNMKISRK